MQILGYATTFLAFSLQIPVAAFCARSQGLARIAVYDIFVAVSYIGAVNTWKGLWAVFDIYLLPG